MNIVLVEPEIPQNAGNIARTCAATGTNLHMVKPLGFSVEDKYLKRAGLDYWDKVNISYYDSFNQLIEKHSNGVFFYATTKAVNSYADVEYPEGAFIVFGKETAGLPEEILLNNKDRCIRIPMIEGARSLNLSNSVAIVLYEALRQNNFKNLNLKGELTQYTW
ncbi:tRNA (uridine(34)/cytosine(34)/5-carboxymethylaminomethyluridine(34)-2'-O)-methyltransferase TrmL [Acetivibrio saccincola]|jgi:tRNA (cytidine/uridine-2'-O-)-methyltransferase|uniref:Putative tRNA (cytidine(34)-2'-O)-methyltransferase n=1 Tax=Acetivibrio saccincola TaxID=1677857 RepID=A0A2K9E9L2_9FIRM|nr:tRNA (uridine(34)/cytosine(34)/5-carboxymethylaminomethyluridine(34)-2'-O)-methyltransferase TrmL [Acetivibrio saccincola]AUG58326.1 tRNA (cytidine(34)-2'-O)-methyltransferase [Acetivibrio saccincola]NLW27273.1 tRNA (uridine(34)/cytosine(34)/5-carboxymethylaminomethyluridine(34)-2'-O)-methyltransferase TrmL [Acetivibrio saccincola]PQQ68203.1 tRNA (uridine(34)/cytosine(34)/5-carboxymethylaminomethyluridine(34)-2'-O)-methyltransferase TrmL [Acetivibrio saccincola]HOA96598.1 tRNA (uridine(34)/c